LSDHSEDRRPRERHAVKPEDLGLQFRDPLIELRQPYAANGLQRDRRWKDTVTGKLNLTFADVLSALTLKAQELEAADRSRYLRIIGIDAIKPDDFRAKPPEKAARRK